MPPNAADADRDDGLMLHELTEVNTMIARYVVRFMDADAGRTERMPLAAEFGNNLPSTRDRQRGMNEQEPTSREAIVGALEVLFESDERWKPSTSPDVTIVTRGWPDGTTDTLILLSPDSAYAVREDAEGRRPWAMTGTLEQILHHARTLLPPDDPNAPKATSKELPRAEWRG